ncbi:MAG: urea carboxylase [Halioglobus sp.]
MFSKVLIANRGAIATRIIRTLQRLGVESVAVYNDADAQSLHVQRADIAVNLGMGTAAETYLDIDKVLQAARDSGAEAIHPGYGFLSENTEFVARCEAQGLVFIGPTVQQMDLFGLKHQAREAAQQAGVPLVPGSPLLQTLDEAQAWAASVGYPVMLKSTAGGGGIGMQVCQNEQVLRAAWESVKRLSANYFANDGVFLEKYVANARHIEVQIFGDGNGQAIALGERDCSAQRRNQKVIEETPAPNLPDAERDNLHATAERLMAAVNYRNAGTVEFIYDADSHQFYFLEVNTRLQVEHGVSEEVWGVDLVEWMLQQGAGELPSLLSLKAALMPRGHAIQVRVYAEDPAQDFRPSAGLLSRVYWPQAEGLRIDHWIESGIEVPTLFDPMLAKVIVHAKDRATALEQLSAALAECEIYGIETNLAYLQAILRSERCQRGELLTRSLAEFDFSPATVQVLVAGTQTTLQDFPGRTGLWHVGVPPSGPMDSLSFRLANRLLGNSADAAGLEITLHGPTLKFNRATQVALTGAAIDATLGDQPLPAFTVVTVAAGEVLRLGKVTAQGARAYLAVAGGFQCPDYLGSRSTFTLGQFGGHVGRALRVSDVLHLAEDFVSPATAGDQLPEKLRPVIGDQWSLRVIYGPHGAPDFFTDEDIRTFFASEWEVHYNSSRTGVRLIGPKPQWSRETGGDAGLHPSNIHDNAYAFGTVDFTGDMPVILGPDGPSLGGFVCPATVISADLWKLGQLKAGARLHFVPVTYEQAVALEAQQLASIETMANTAPQAIMPAPLVSPIVRQYSVAGDDVICRLAGDHFLLVELGPQELDIQRRFKVHALMLWFETQSVAGLRELTPGIRSLQIHYDAQQLPLAELLKLVERATAALVHSDDLSVPSRIVHLPLSWDDEACRLAIEKYMQSVRSDAPWCPSNLEFIRRINGLADIEAVKEIVFSASYLVMGLGDVYLGAPVATPLDPRHRLVTTKYNPARTWTAENSVGIGGAYLCVYGMEGPGGYQFVGRTLQMWNRYRQTSAFTQPWLLRFFDQIRFYPVDAQELTRIRREFPLGNYPLKIEQTTFNLGEYQAFLQQHGDAIEQFQLQRQSAFADELAQWKRDGQLTYQQDESAVVAAGDEVFPEGVSGIDSPVSGSVWRVMVAEGDRVAAGDTVMVLESMKMEIDIQASVAGRINKIIKHQGHPVTAGQTVLWLQEE